MTNTPPPAYVIRYVALQYMLIRTHLMYVKDFIPVCATW